MVETINIAQLCPATYALGPGKRFVVWVQGCPFNCNGCVSPDWIPIKPNRVMSIDELAHRITANDGLEGITISGGEPMLQAEALASLIRRVRDVCPTLSTIAFSGFTSGQLQKRSAIEPSVGDLLSQLDVLIDGLYRSDLNDDLGLRGSSNQRVHFLTPRYRNLKEEFEQKPRAVEVHLLKSEMLMIGVPPAKSLQTFSSLALHLNT